MSTPLYDALTQFAAQNPLRMAMPGHKGKPIPGLPAEYARLDFTELPPTGNLYGEDMDCIAQAEQAWAEAWGADSCLFLTGGSTQGIHTMLMLSDSDTILIDRVSHRSIHTGLALLGKTPVWLTRPWLSDVGTAGPLEPETVEAELKAHPECRAVCVTSPTYYGVLSDIPTLAQVCHRHGAKLLVDGAHGAHLFLLGENPYRGADLVTVSAHKTLPAPGQSALLFGSSIAFDQLRQASLIFATSSPSSLAVGRGKTALSGDRTDGCTTAEKIPRFDRDRRQIRPHPIHPLHRRRLSGGKVPARTQHLAGDGGQRARGVHLDLRGRCGRGGTVGTSLGRSGTS